MVKLGLDMVMCLVDKATDDTDEMFAEVMAEMDKLGKDMDKQFDQMSA